VLQTWHISETSALADLEHLWVLYPGDKTYPLAKNITVLPITKVGGGWVYP